MPNQEKLSRRQFLKIAGLIGAGLITREFFERYSYLFPEESVNLLRNSGIHNPVSPEERKTFEKITESLPNLVHATIYPINPPMLETVLKSFPLLSGFYNSGVNYSFADIVDLPNKRNTWNLNKDGSWAFSICLASTLTARLLVYGERLGLLENLNYTPHNIRAHPGARIRLTNQLMYNADPLLGLVEAGVFYTKDNQGKESLIDLEWRLKKPFEAKFSVFNSNGESLIENPFSLSLENYTNQDLENMRRENYILTAQLFY